jgi:SAM-dependent methyltransferase
VRSASDLRRAAYYRLFSADGYLSGLPSTDSLLDVGCSDGRGSETLSRRGADGVDIYRPALETARRDARRTRVVQADVRSLPYRDGSHDVVIALDVVEHFTKSDALAVMAELERVARRLVVIATPRGFLPQPGTAEEPWQEHRCGFEVAELEASGYRVEALGGPKWLRGDYGAFRAGPLGQLAVLLTKPIVAPSVAFALLAAKRVA